MKISSGQYLGVRRLGDLSGRPLLVLQQLGFTRWGTGGYINFVDSGGISFYLMTHGRSDVAAYCPHGVWQHYFEAGESVNPGYVKTCHVSKQFPEAFV